MECLGCIEATYNPDRADEDRFEEVFDAYMSKLMLDHLLSSYLYKYFHSETMIRNLTQKSEDCDTEKEFLFLEEQIKGYFRAKAWCQKKLEATYLTLKDKNQMVFTPNTCLVDE